MAPPIRVLEPFRAPLTPYSAGHRGIDLAVRAGAEVAAAAPGVVRFAGRVADRPLVSIDHGDGVISSIEPVEPSVSVGDVLERGSPIGRVAAGGHCADVCAHFGVRVDEEYVSPLLFLGGVPRAVLLPLSE
ncbi:M23 family metallopeptidase [Agromyces silvae]|uniref:M23 family metallopeptidase n=1 Tax=Agromyces silvae TaxID=3388266 RepID=UPI0035A06884